jgi:putative ABC transport system ATP-binding protein
MSSTQTLSTRTAASSPAVAVRAEAATKVYGAGATAVTALDGVSIGLPAGRFTAIMGPSGSGKSTLMHCMAGLDSLSSGRILLGEVEVGKLSDRQLTKLRRDHIGFVFQAFNLVPTLTALENITLPGKLAGRRADKAWLDTVIDTVGLRDRLSHRPAELSGGQQQRVAVARALAARPQVIFADEPTGNLDSRTGAEILAFMRRAVDELGQTIVMVTHDPVAAGYADAAVFLGDGQVVDVMDDPTSAGVLEHMKDLDTVRAPAVTTALSGALAGASGSR